MKNSNPSLKTSAPREDLNVSEYGNNYKLVTCWGLLIFPAQFKGEVQPEMRSVIIYSPSCSFTPIWRYFMCSLSLTCPEHCRKHFLSVWESHAGSERVNDDTILIFGGRTNPSLVFISVSVLILSGYVHSKTDQSFSLHYGLLSTLRWCFCPDKSENSCGVNWYISGCNGIVCAFCSRSSSC